jgi:hypothetical protein
MPSHGDLNDPLWRRLWNAYEPVITGLRRIPLVTDVEICGGELAITAELTDGSHLWIGSNGSLPEDPAELEGFHVKRAHHDNPTIDDLVYDSTEDGEQAEYGNNVVTLIQAITAFVHERGLAPRVVDLLAIHLQGVTKQHRTLSTSVEGPFRDRDAALKEYGYVTHELGEKNWRCVHEQGGTDWPLTVWERDGAIVTVYLTRVGVVTE